MSQLTEWFIAEPAEVKDIIVSEAHEEKWSFVTLQGIIDSDLMELAEHFQTEFSDYNMIEFDPMVIEIDSSFIKALASIDESKKNETLKAWASREGLEAIDSEVLDNALNKMIDLSKEAVTKNKKVIQFSA